MKFSRCKKGAFRPKQQTCLGGALSPLPGASYFFWSENRKSSTRTCISSSRSILQIRLLALQ